MTTSDQPAAVEEGEGPPDDVLLYANGTPRRCIGCQRWLLQSDAEETFTAAPASRDNSKAGGVSSYCKPCRAARSHARYIADPEAGRAHVRAQMATYARRSAAEIAADCARLHPDGLKVCGRCRKQLSLAEFPKDRSKPDGLYGVCLACHAADGRSRYVASGRVPATPEVVRARKHAYYAAHREAIRAYQRTWNLANPEVVRKHARNYYAAHRDVIIAHSLTYKAAYAARSDDEISAARQRLRPDGLKRCRKCRKRLALSEFSAYRTSPDGLQPDCRACKISTLRKRAVSYWLLTGQIDWALQRCYLCHTDLAGKYHVEHLIPSSAGGTDDVVNLLPACAPCNHAKHARNVADVLLERHPYAHPGDPAIEPIRQLAAAAADPRALVQAIERLDPVNATAPEGDH